MANTRSLYKIHSSPVAWIVLLIILTADLVHMVGGAPSDLASFRGGGGGRGSQKWGMNAGDLLQQLTEDQKGRDKVDNVDDAVNVILSRKSSPTLRLFLYDRLFRRHLQLMIAKPSPRHLRQLQNRLSALHRRRTDDMSSRFFLRD